MKRPPLLLSPSELAGLGLPAVTPPGSFAPYLRPVGTDLPLGEQLAQQQGPYPGMGILGCNAERVILAGGALAQLLVNPEVTPWEQLYRRLTDYGMYSDEVSPSRPYAVELGAFRVPEQFALLLFDLRPDLYRWSGVDPGDMVPVEARRFSGSLGFEVTVNQRQPGNLLFQLEPVPAELTQQQAFTQNPAFAPDFPASLRAVLERQTKAPFKIAESSSYAAAAGVGSSLLPQRPQRYGALSVPFTLYARSGDTVQVRCVVFHPITSPLACIEYDIAGMLVPEIILNSLLECGKPTTYGSGAPGSVAPGAR